MSGSNLPSMHGSMPNPEAMTGDQSSAERESSTSSPEMPPARLTEAQKADQVAALLRGEGPDGEGSAPDGSAGEEISASPAPPDSPQEGGNDLPGGEGAENGEGDQEGHREPLTLKQAAEKLGIDPRDLYQMEISTGDGETITLSELKDGWQERASAAHESAERSADLDRREARVIADQQVWSMLAQSGQLPREAVAQAYDQLAQVVERETDTLFDLVPEFQDAAKFDHFRRGMVQALGEVGYKPQEIAFTDHRQALFVRRYLQQQKELEATKAELGRLKREANPAPKAGKPNGRGGGTSRRSAVINRAQGGTESDKVAAVGEILKGL